MFEFMKSHIEATKARSAWDKGVKLYALELVDSAEEYAQHVGRNPANTKELNAFMLNGASNWREYSEGGSALVYDCEIAERLCTPSELKKTRNGERRPNANEDWIDVQARALRHAAYLARFAFRAAQCPGTTSYLY